MISAGAKRRGVPELPETETIARDLDRAIRGARITAVTVPRADVLRAATARVFQRALTGATITTVTRRAKSVVVQLGDDHHLVVTPRFTGALLIGGPLTAPDVYDAIRFTLADGRQLRYRDVRRLGTVTLLDSAAYEVWSEALGPEPLDPALNAAHFVAIVQGSRRAVKTILMDQRRLAGIGNIYATEALWHARVAPSRAGAGLSAAAITRVFSALRTILPEAIAARGTTFRDYQDAHGGRGGYAEHLHAYGRAGLPCPRCATLLATDHTLEGRRSVYCARCQR
jgi:formamidopyrimidine-DNA glycosylase